MRAGKDVQPLSAFRANAAGYLKQVRESRRPLVITQHGRGAAVVLDVDVYDALMDELTVVRDIRVARAELDAGEGLDHEVVLAELRTKVTDCG